MLLDVTDHLALRPAFDWGDPQAMRLPPRGELNQIGYRIFALLLWPNDRVSQDRFLAKIAAQSAELSLRVPPPAGWPEGKTRQWPSVRLQANDRITNFSLMRLGGKAAALDAPSRDEVERQTAKQQPKWVCAGTVLWVTAAIACHGDQSVAGKASVRRSIHITECLTDWNRDFIEKAWREFKPVSHILAALTLNVDAASAMAERFQLSAETPMLQPGHFLFEGLGWTLGRARSFQEWATGFKPHPGKEAVLRSDVIWCIPSHTPPWALPLNLPTANAPFLEAFHSYTPHGKGKKKG